jgi:hypothetical protein
MCLSENRVNEREGDRTLTISVDIDRDVEKEQNILGLFWIEKVRAVERQVETLGKGPIELGGSGGGQRHWGNVRLS